MKPSGSSFLGVALLPVLLLCSTSPWIISTAEANVNFSIPINLSVKPGETILLNWTLPTVANANTGPFTLVLRALTGQRYVIENNVAQSPTSLPVQIPTNATGGPHSFYAYYIQGDTNMTISPKFAIQGRSITTTLPPAPPATATSTATTATSTPSNAGADSGMSGGAIGGIIIGVAAVLMLVALIFFCRHRRRRVAEGGAESRSMNDGRVSKHQDKESLTRGAEPVDGAMVPTPLGPGGPKLTGPRPYAANPGSQQQLQQNQHLPPPQQQQQQQQPGGARNPFDNAERIPSPGSGPRQQQQQYPYQPPQFSPNSGSHPPDNNPYGPPNTMMQPPHPAHQQQQLVRGQSPFGGVPLAAAAVATASHRDSFASELESVYDPRMMNNNGPFNGGQNSVTPDMAMMRNSPSSGSSLTHTPSGRRYPGQNNMPQNRSNLSPHPASSSPQPGQQQQQQHNPNPFAEQDRESMALAAAVAAAAASPVLTNRQKHQQQVESRSQSPANAMAMEMQPLDIQQHHFEQQKKMQQRQQQQIQQSQSPLSHSQHTPTFFDDKAEFEEEEEVVQPAHQQNQQNPQAKKQQAVLVDEQTGPAYTGYRDTIFGAYGPEGDDEDDEDEIQHKSPLMPIISASVPSQSSVQRKKSVKFSGPAASPVVLPSHEAAREHQIKRIRQMEESQHQHQHQQQALNESQYDEEEEEDDYDLQERMLQTEAAAVIPSPRGPFNPPAQSQNSPSLDTVNAFGNGFYEDVLAAVDKKAVPAPSSPSTTATAFSAPTSPSSTITPSPTFVKPPMPKVPSSPPPQEVVAHQYSVQTQMLPSPQPQHLQPVAQEVFGAPSPRITPAVKTH